MNIREGTAGDSASIAELISVLANKYIVSEFSEAGKSQFLESNDEDSIRKFINGGFEYFVAEVSGQVVGIVGMRENSHLYHLFVAEKYQGVGLSRQLWEKAKENCLRNGNPGKFTVNSSNNAVGVYESFGFKLSESMQESNGVLFNPMTLEKGS